MNPLTHVQINLELFEELNLKIDRDLFVLGGVLPDLDYIGGLSSVYDYHKDAKSFIQYLLENDPNYVALGIGFLFHGEFPEGLDFHAHKSEGFIEKKLQKVKPLVQAEHPKIKDHELTNISHSLIEFACDYLSSYEAANALNFAFKRVDLKRIAFHLSTFFKIPRHKTYRVLKFFRKFNFQKLRTNKGVSSSVKKFLLWKDFNAPTLFQKYSFLKTQFHFMRKKGIQRVFNEVKNSVQNELPVFIGEAKKNMKKNLPKHLPPGLI